MNHDPTQAEARAAGVALDKTANAVQLLSERMRPLSRLLSSRDILRFIDHTMPHLERITMLLLDATRELTGRWDLPSEKDPRIQCQACKKLDYCTRSSIANDIWKVELCVDCKDTVVRLVRDFIEHRETLNAPAAVRDPP